MAGASELLILLSPRGGPWHLLPLCNVFHWLVKTSGGSVFPVHVPTAPWLQGSEHTSLVFLAPNRQFQHQCCIVIDSLGTPQTHKT